MPLSLSRLTVLAAGLLPLASLAQLPMQICNGSFQIQPMPASLVRPDAFVRAVSRDFYLNSPPLFPKLEIAAYVEAMGFAVPKRFASFADALASGKRFLARSEFWREYFEAAGLFESYRIDPAKPADAVVRALEVFEVTGDEKKLWAEFHRIGDLPERIRYYSELTGQSIQAVRAAAGFSYWELLGGENFSMIADSAIKGRYHLTNGNRYLTIEDGRVTFDSLADSIGLEAANAQRAADPLYSDIAGMVSYYESIRKLGRFDPNHCPVIEFQAVGDQRYFLQYHRSRDFEPAKFSLDRAPESGEVEAMFVRGVTPPGGIEIEVQFRVVEGLGAADLDGIDAAYFRLDGYEGVNPVFAEMVTRHLDVWFQAPKPGTTGMSLNGHLSVSTAFNPGLYIGLDRSAIFPPNVLQLARANPKQKISRRVRIVSDGRKAYIKPL